MISVFVKKNEAGPEAGLVGDLGGNKTHHYSGYTNYPSFQETDVRRPRKQRPFSSVSDSALSGLKLKGSRMATQGHQRTRSRSRGSLVSPQWLAERSYTEGNTDNDGSASWHLQPTFPGVKTEKPPKNQHKPSRLLKRESSTETLLRKQSKIEREYKGMRDFTRSTNKNTKTPPSHNIAYKPPRGYTNFVAGKPLMHQERPVSGREKAHQRFLEKLEAQNRMMQDLNDSDDEMEDAGQRKGFLRIPSCSDMDVCLQGSCNASGSGLSIQLAMDGLRIANNIERSLSAEPSPEEPAKDIGKNSTDTEKVNDKNTKYGKTNENYRKKANVPNGQSALISTGSSSNNPGKQYKMNTKNPPEKTTQLSEAQGSTYVDGANQLYEWSSVTTTKSQ